MNKIKEKKHDHLNRYRKSTRQKLTSFLILKTQPPIKTGVEGNLLNVIKGTYETPAVNITLNGIRLNAFPLRSGIRQGNSLSPLLFIIVLEVLSTTRQEK